MFTLRHTVRSHPQKRVLTSHQHKHQAWRKKEADTSRPHARALIFLVSTSLVHPPTHPPTPPSYPPATHPLHRPTGGGPASTTPTTTTRPTPAAVASIATPARPRASAAAAASSPIPRCEPWPRAVYPSGGGRHPWCTRWGLATGGRADSGSSQCPHRTQNAHHAAHLRLPGATHAPHTA